MPRPTFLDDPTITGVDPAIVAQGVAAGLDAAMVQRGGITPGQVPTFVMPAPGSPEYNDLQAAMALDAQAAALEAGQTIPPAPVAQPPIAQPGAQPTLPPVPTAFAPPTVDPTIPPSPGGEGGEPTSLDPNAPPAIPDGHTRITFGDQYVDATPDQIQQAYLTALWLQNQPDEIRNAWGAIEARQAVAVPHEEYTRFQAWKATGAPTPQQALTQQRPDLSLVDPEVAAYVANLEGRITATPAPSAVPSTVQQPTVDTPPVFQGMDPTTQYNQQIQRQQRLDMANTKIVGKYALDATALDTLQAEVVRQNLIPIVSQRHAVTNPLTGGILHAGDFGVIVEECYETVIATSPTFRNLHESYILARAASQNAAVTSKKALAGSLASVAPAAVPSVPQDPRNMSFQETVTGITGALRELQAAGTYGS